jgi:hypothetical protein
VVERPWVGYRCFTSLSLELMLRLGNLRPGEALRLERSGSVIWKVDISKVVAPTYVSYGPMGWPPQASIENIDRMP